MDQTPYWIKIPVVVAVLAVGIWFKLKSESKRDIPPPLPHPPKKKPPALMAVEHPIEHKNTSGMLRLSVGPSPWAWTNRSHIMGGKRYRFRELDQTGNLAGITTVLDELNNVILLLDFQCYARFLDSGRVLLWWEDGEKDAKQITFTDFNFSDLSPITNPVESARQMRSNKSKSFGLDASKSKSFACFLDAGEHPIDSPSAWAEFEETLVLADHAPGSNGYDIMHRAIFVFDWIGKKITVIPQDWFNNGKYDFGYQWITRVARKESGVITGEGVRLGFFELDGTGRNIKSGSQKMKATLSSKKLPYFPATLPASLHLST